MSAINLSAYDVTQIDWKNDGVEDGLIPQNATLANQWIPLVKGIKRWDPKTQENRLEHSGNSQMMQLDKSVKKWFEFELAYLLYKYEAGTPNWNWWDIVRYGFWGGDTGAPVTRPGSVWLGIKYNRATPEFWSAAACKISEIVLSGDMTKDALELALRGMGRIHRFDTNSYVQGTSTRRADPATDPIIPASDVTIKINNTDVTNLIQRWTLTLRRTYQQRGRANPVLGSASQIAIDGSQYREFHPETLEGRFQAVLDPYGTTSAEILGHFSDTALSNPAVEIQAQNTIGGKQIQFTAGKRRTPNQPGEEKKAPLEIDLEIVGTAMTVNTL